MFFNNQKSQDDEAQGGKTLKRSAHLSVLGVCAVCLVVLVCAAVCKVPLAMSLDTTSKISQVSQTTKETNKVESAAAAEAPSPATVKTPGISVYVGPSAIADFGFGFEEDNSFYVGMKRCGVAGELVLEGEYEEYDRYEVVNWVWEDLYIPYEDLAGFYFLENWGIDPKDFGLAQAVFIELPKDYENFTMDDDDYYMGVEVGYKIVDPHAFRAKIQEMSKYELDNFINLLPLDENGKIQSIGKHNSQLIPYASRLFHFSGNEVTLVDYWQKFNEGKVYHSDPDVRLEKRIYKSKETPRTYPEIRRFAGDEDIMISDE